MHALLVKVSIEANKEQGAEETLKSQIVPRVKQAPGFIHGYWLAPKGSGSLEGESWVLFDSEENARAAEQMAKNSPVAEGVSFTSFEIREVIADA